MPIDIRDDGCIDIRGSSAKPCFLFLHGFGTSPLDLLPLAQSLAELDYSCRLVALEGHLGRGDLLSTTEPAAWRVQVATEYGKLSEAYDEVIVVGFSLGGVLALELASHQPVAGVVAISTFVAPKRPRLASWMLRIAAHLPIGWIPRWLQTTHAATRKKLLHAEYLPPEAALRVIDIGGEAPAFARKLTCPVLLIHSMDDRVASYKPVAGMARTNGSVSLVTLVGLNHFLQFDVPPDALRDVMLSYVCPARAHAGYDSSPLEERYEQRSDDARQWADIVFRLILAFFTIFGALLFFSLEDVLAETIRAPTFLIAYAFILSLYVQLASLYFFYLVRVDVFLKCMIEPLTGVFGWVGFRTNPYISDTTSATMTRLTSISIVGLPLVAALGFLIFAALKYWDTGFGPQANNAFHQIAGLVSFLMWLWALRGVLALNAYTTRHVYQRVPLSVPRSETAYALDKMFKSIAPGVVRPTLPVNYPIPSGWSTRDVPQQLSTLNS